MSIFPLHTQRRKSAFGSFLVKIGHIASGFHHRTHDLVKRDHSRVGKEVGKRYRIDGAHRGNRISLNAGDLHQTADGIAGQAQVVLQGDLGGVLDLGGAQTEELG